MTVGALLRSIDSRELTEWQIYERMYGPLGQQRDDQLAALIAAAVANVFRDKGKAAEPKDYLPRWEAPQRPAEPPEEVADRGDDP
ncbi:phage tail assembly protein T [Actinomadura formosensis]|uniref:phage tail assembly protein T n=1 Tax=Actinomadura formosensis TaxID=60706 RepID=UPI003D9136E7